MPRYFKRLVLSLGCAGTLFVVAILILAPPAAQSVTARLEPAPVTAGASVRPTAPTFNALLAPPFTITLQPVVSGLSNPVDVTHAGDGSGRLFVVEQAGRIRVIKNGILLGTPFLSITNQVACCGERGLLSAAFDPGYKANGTFYVDYTTNAPGNFGDTVIARYVVSNPASDVAHLLAVTHLITIDQPQANHNGGQLQFGVNDNYLYIGMGDGGGGGDQHGTIGNGQDLGALLGKILRLNVRGVPTYTIPPSNPFTQTVGARPEIWAYGLRNPWRFSFDRANGDLYIGDVGQNCWEEIDYQPASSHGGENYGWRLMEGFHAFDPGDMNNCSQPLITPLTLTLPIVDYGHGLGSAVTGGYVYRGGDYPWMKGVYFYSDSGSGRIWTIEQVSPGNWSGSQRLDSAYSVTSFGEDGRGELYVTAYGSNGGIYQITSSQPPDLSATTKCEPTTDWVR